jgi:hypothetical protein
VRTRANIAAAATVGAPCLSWLIASQILHGSGSASTYPVLFVGLPFALTLAAAVAAGRRAASLSVALLSAGIGLASWLVGAILLASKFAD